VAPVPIEDTFKDAAPYVSNVMVIGDDKKFLSALITFKVDVDPGNQVPTKNLTIECMNYFKTNFKLDLKTSDDACKNEVIAKDIAKAWETANNKSVSRAAHVRKWTLLSTDFSIPGEELTPTLKLKRRKTEAKYQNEIGLMYEEAKL
jgi:long-chain-fatty-acid--CoA ligase ACSBG